MPCGDENQPRFLGARDNFDFETGFAADARDEFRAVLGLAHRAGRDRTHPIDVTKFDEFLKIAEGADREVHRFLAQRPGFEGAAAEPDGLFDAIDHIDVAVAIHVGNHHVN